MIGFTIGLARRCFRPALLQLTGVEEGGAKCGVGTNIGTLVTLNTVFVDPLRNVNGNATLFVSSCSLWKGPVLATNKSADRQIITLLRVDGEYNIFDELGHVLTIGFFIDQLGPFGRNIHLGHISTTINGGVVHFHHSLTFATKRLNDKLLHLIYGLIVRNYAGNFKEGRLHDGIGTITRSEERRVGKECSSSWLERRI